MAFCGPQLPGAHSPVVRNTGVQPTCRNDSPYIPQSALLVRAALPALSCPSAQDFPWYSVLMDADSALKSLLGLRLWSEPREEAQASATSSSLQREASGLLSSR